MSNKDFSLFYFATIDRSYFLDKHNFYVAEARKRLFSQFSDSDLEAEARQREQDYYEAAGKRFDPDYDDEGAICEQAHDEGWICPYISRHLLSLNPLLACCRRYSRGER